MINEMIMDMYLENESQESLAYIEYLDYIEEQEQEKQFQDYESYLTKIGYYKCFEKTIKKIA